MNSAPLTLVKTAIVGAVGSIVSTTAGLLSTATIGNAASGIQTNNNKLPTMAACIETALSGEHFTAKYLGNKAKPECGTFARVSCPTVLKNQLVSSATSGGLKTFPGNPEECRFEVLGTWTDLSASQRINDWRTIQKGKLPDITPEEESTSFAQYITYAAVGGGLLLILIGTCGCACMCNKNKRQAPNQAGLPQKPGVQWKKKLLQIGGGLTAGVVGGMLFLRFGGEGAMAAAGLISVATATGADYRINGNQNLGVGGGGNALVSVSTLNDETGTPDNPTDKAWGNWGAAINEQNKRLCMSKGMLLRNPADDAWMAWDEIKNGGTCMQSIPSDMINGQCNSDNKDNFGKAYGASSRKEKAEAETAAIAAAAAVGGVVNSRHTRAILALVTPAEPDISRAVGRCGDQFAWPVTDGDYTAFNGLLLSGGVLVARGLFRVANPVVVALADYINSSG